MKRYLTKCFGVFLFALLFTLLFSCVSASAAEYPDAKGHWGEEAINKWSDSGILTGYSNGNFGPNDNVTRAQLASILYRMWGCEPKIGHSYTDLSTSAWYYESLATMSAYGIALDHGDLIYPDETLTREEAIYMVAKAFNFGTDVDKAAEIEGVSDSSEIDSAFASRISFMFRQTYLKGASDGAFHPKNMITRAEIMQIVDNIFDLCISKPGDYTLAANQVALVTCGDVSITYTQIPNFNYTNMGKVFLMPSSAKGSISFKTSNFKIYSFMLYVYGISEDGFTWTEEDIHAVLDRSIKLSDPENVPDHRFAGGIGTKRSPYLIETADQFLLFGDVAYSTNIYVYFKLQNDIELPRGQKTIDLSLLYADLDGNGHTVTYHITEDSNIFNGFGLFSSWRGHCSNLTLAGTIDFTAEEPLRSDPILVGGLAPYSSGSATNCTSTVDITVRYSGEKRVGLYVGGLFGALYNGVVSNCTVDGSISVNAPVSISNLCVGGMVGKAEEGSLLNCTVGGSVSVIAADSISSIGVGGLVGFSAPRAEIVSTSPFDSKVKFSKTGVAYTNCGSTATVSVQGGSTPMVGGLIGMLTYPIVDTEVPKEIYGVVENCWSTAKVSSSGNGFQSDCGGLVGHLQAGTIRGCWARPAITNTGWSLKNVGGIAGASYEYGIIADS